MARTIKITVYSFHELSEAAKEKAIEKLYDLNLSHDWWESVYWNAEEVGCKIHGFDVDRGLYCHLDFIWEAEEVAKAILEDHGDSCDTWKASKDFLFELKNLQEIADEQEEAEEDIEILVAEYRKALSECYLTILQSEYEYLTSEEAIIDSIIANEYEFTEDGDLL